MSTISYNQIGIIGGSQGMGKWLMGFLQAAGQHVGFTSEDETSQYPDNLALAAGSDVVILAVPISKMEAVLSQIFPALHGKLLIDVCSVKAAVLPAFERLSGANPAIACRYLPMHPMFAPSAAGIRGQVVIFNDSFNISLNELQWWKNLFTQAGAVIQHITSGDHDRLMGVIQGLNHFNLFVSAKTLADTGADIEFIKTLSSPSYRIFLLFYTRYVLQNPRLYAEIQIFNPYVKEVTKRFMSETAKLLAIIEARDFAAFENYVNDIQPFFAANSNDSAISDKLIETLGHLLADTSAVAARRPQPPLTSS